MSLHPETRSVEPNDGARIQERDDSTASSDRADVTEQVVESRAGVEQAERVVTGQGGVEHRERSVRDTGAERQISRFRVTQLIWLFFGLIVGLIGLRVLLKLIGANPENDFASLIYNAAALFLAPFFGLIGSPSSGGMVLEVPSLVAMLVYALAGWVIVRVISQFFFPPTTRSTSTYDSYKS